VSFTPIAKRSSQRGSRRSAITKRLVATQGDGPSFRGQQITILDLPCDPQTVSTGGAGTVATRINVNTDLVANWSSFAAVFAEFRIRQAVFEMTPIGPHTGVTIFAWKDDQFEDPTENSIESTTNFIKNNNSSCAKSTFSTRWIPRDLSNLEFDATSDAASTIACLQIYTNTTTYGTLPDTNLWLVRAKLRVELRGLSNPA
jgi:hypothetical protein